MELFQQGCLDLPEDVIKIWADNGFGKMVSRRQGNANPRVTALPPLGDTGAHGLYYHASFYDLQAASHITMLPNSAEFVCEELTNALARGVDDYWLINCSNVKPHATCWTTLPSCGRPAAATPKVTVLPMHKTTTVSPMALRWQSALRATPTTPCFTANIWTTTPATSSTTMCPGC